MCLKFEYFFHIPATADWKKREEYRLIASGKKRFYVLTMHRTKDLFKLDIKAEKNICGSREKMCA